MSLHGIVLAGGKSRRMGRDKGLLCYDGQHSQMERMAKLLSGFCSSVEISCRSEQQEAWRALPGLKWRVDHYHDLGPLGGILTALEAHPGKAILAVACDFPYLDAQTLRFLADGRDTKKWATSFVQEDGLPEPLCTIYEPRALHELRGFLAETGRASPRAALTCGDVLFLSAPQHEVLINANEPHEYAEALERLREDGLWVGL